jgi:hypothetical protein
MTGQGKLVAGVIVGAGVMYLLDPDQGARRRDQLRDRGMQLRSRFRQEQADHETLPNRVRSAIGRVATYPGAIRVTLSQGLVTLAGDVLLDEVNDLIDRVERVRGVDQVRNELTLHRTAAGVPQLGQAGSTQEPEADQGSWTPTTRLFLGATGGVLALHGARLSGLGGKTLTFLGSGLLSRAASRVPPRSSSQTSPETETASKSMMPSATEPVAATKSATKRRRSRR